MTNRATLFGGALFSAGLAIGAVNQGASADFTFTNGQQNYGLAYGLKADGSYFFDLIIDYGPSYFGSVNYSGDGLDIATWANPTSMGVIHDRDPGDAIWNYSRGTTGAFFQVTEDTTVRLAWDFGAWDQVNSYMRITDLSGGGGDFFEIGGAGSGTATLTAGDEYFFRIFIRGNTGGGDSFARMIIPAPGSLPLLAAGSLVVSRRRRRE